jgi:hypothetical protein
MSHEKAVSLTNAAAAAADPAVTPESVVEQLRALQAQIPSYGQLTVPTAQTLRTVSSVNPEFAQAAIHAVSASPIVQATVGRSADDLQTSAQMVDRWSIVRDELKVTLDGVTSAVLLMKHSIGQSTLLTYTVCKKLVKQPEHSGLLPHVDLMRKANRMGRKRKVSPQPQPVPQAPAPSPTPEPTPSPAGNPAPASHV